MGQWMFAKLYCGNHFIMYASHIIMLYTLNTYSVVCQLQLNKTGRGEKKKKVIIRIELWWTDLYSFDLKKLLLKKKNSKCYFVNLYWELMDKIIAYLQINIVTLWRNWEDRVQMINNKNT